MLRRLRRKICLSYKKIKHEREMNKINEVKNKFYLEEYKGSIFIMCDATAIYKANEKDTSSELIKKIETFRNTALIREKLKNDYSKYR